MQADDEHLERARALRSVHEAAALYRDWAADYDRDVFERAQVIGSARIADLLADHLTDAGVRVVDLGCGTGAVGERLAARGVCHVTGLDLSPEMLAVAESKRVYDHLAVADLTDPAIVTSGLGPFTHGHVGADAARRLLAIHAPGAIVAWVVAPALWTGFRRALEDGDATVISADLEPIRLGADDVAHMVLARLA
jgi:SAM-dependent methyltransferase